MSERLSPVDPRTALSLVAGSALVAAAISVCPQLRPNNDSECLNPTQSQLETVDALIKDADERILPISYQAAQHEDRELATSLHLKLPDKPTLVAATIPAGYFGVARSYLADLDIKLVLDGIPDTEGTTRSLPLTVEEIGSESAATGIHDIVTAVSKIPVELLDYSQIDTIHLTKFTSETLGYMQPDSGDITIDPLRKQTGQTFNHELYHLIDEQTCGDSNDPTFTDLNPDNVYTAGDSYLSAVDEHDESEPTNFTPNAADVVTIDDYSMKSPAEDKATIGATIFGGSILDSAKLARSGRAPVLHDKYRLILGRLFAIDSRIGTYFANKR